MRFHVDNRRIFWGDIFDTPFGDINIVKLYPGTVIAWHRHQRQDDRIAVFGGDLLVRAVEPNGTRHEWELSFDRRADPITIPAGWWHGYGSHFGATLIQFNGPGKWDGTDEERKSLDEIPWTIPTP